MAPFISQQEYEAWCGQSYAPITDEVGFFSFPLSVITKHFPQWVFEYEDDKFYSDHPTFHPSRRSTVDFERVRARREDLPDLFMPQNLSHSRWLFCETDSDWTAVFALSPRPENTSMIFAESFFAWVFEKERENLPAGEYYFLSIQASPRLSVAEHYLGLRDELICPHPAFESAGECCLNIDGRKLSSNGEVETHSGCFERFNSSGKYSLCHEPIPDFMDAEMFQRVSKLAVNYKGESMGPEIANDFGFRELNAMAGRFGLRPFANDFYAPEGMLGKIRRRDAPQVWPKPRIPFRDFQRLRCIGPDVIRNDQWPFDL